MLGLRHVQTLLLFCNTACIFICQLHLSTAVVAMTNAATTNPDFPEFSWNEKEISYILSSFFWGYLVTPLFGGVACNRWGVKMTMTVAMLGSTLMTAIIPEITLWGGWQALCITRFVMGLFQGVLIPAIFQHMANWTPTDERNRLCALSLTGSEFGVFVSYALSGVIAAGPLGWPGIFYVSSGICVLWIIFWIIFAADNPTKSKFISENELQYIESSIGHDMEFHKKKIPIPWLAIFTSIPFITIFLTRAAGMWSLGTVHYQMPLYLNGVLKMDIKDNALYSTLPFMVSFIMSFVFIAVADIIKAKNLLSLANLRRTFNTIGYWTPAAGLIPIGFLSEEYSTWAIVFLTIGIGVNSAGNIGSLLNVIELSPTHSGILMGLVNSIINVMRMLSPLFVGVVVSDLSNRSEWQIVFGQAAIIFFLGNLIYLIFGAFEPQPWDAADYMQPKGA